MQLSTSPPLEPAPGKVLYVGIPPPPRILAVPPHITERTVYVERPQKEAKGAKKPKDVMPFNEVNDTEDEYAPSDVKKRKRAKGNAPAKPKKPKKDEASADEMDVDDADADERPTAKSKRLRLAPRAAPKMSSEVFAVSCERCRKSVPRLVCRKRVLHSKNAKVGACYFCSRDKVGCKGRGEKVRDETPAETQARLDGEGTEERPAAPQPSNKIKSREVIEDDSDVDMVKEPVKTGKSISFPSRQSSLKMNFRTTRKTAKKEVAIGIVG